MLLRDAMCVAIDFETTGICSGFIEEPWQIGLAFVQNGQIQEKYAYSRYLKVDLARPFNPYVPGRYASVREILANSKSLTELWEDLAPWLEQRPLIAHNAQVERKILSQNFPMHHFGPWIDTLSMSRKTFPRAKSHKLSDLIPILGLLPKVTQICPENQPHDAWYDAVACAVLFEYFLTLPQWQNVSLEDTLF